MEIEKKKGKGSIVAIIILLILVLGLGAFIVYDKVSNNKTKCITEEVSKDVDTNKEKDTEKEPVKEETVKPNTVETRQCTGVYSGNAAISMNAMTKELNYGLLTITIDADGNFESKKENEVDITGKYIIVENALLLKAKPTECLAYQDCSERYRQFFYISDDCTTISGYEWESYTLTRSN